MEEDWAVILTDKRSKHNTKIKHSQLSKCEI